jgi:multicomponent Na+:H+ antiporter subunit G
VILLIDVASGVLLLAGAAFVLIGAVGILRLPDALAQLHAAGITDTLGVALIVLGLVVKAGFTLLSVKLLLILFFLLITNPTASHALGRAVMHYRQRPWRDGPENNP